MLSRLSRCAGDRLCYHGDKASCSDDSYPKNAHPPSAGNITALFEGGRPIMFDPACSGVFDA